MTRRTSGFGSAVVIVAALAPIACGPTGSTGPVVREHHTVARGAATRARVDIEMSGGELTLKSGAATLFEGDFDFNVSALKPAMAYTVVDGLGTLKVTQGSTSGSYENNWRLNLDETTPVDLHVTLAAGDAQLVIGRVNVETLNVRLGAGDLVLDLRGTPARSYSVSVQAGAGDTTIHLPATAGISARTASLIAETNVSGLEKRDGRWINPRATGSAVTIDLNVQHGIGDLKLTAE
jgi:hypothetical protein